MRLSALTSACIGAMCGLLVAAVVTGCAGDWNVLTVEGVLVEASGEVTDTVPQFVKATIALTNTGSRPVTLVANRDCKLRLQIYGDPARTGRPVWPSEYGYACSLVAQEIIIAAGGKQEFSVSEPVTGILDTGLPEGLYYFALQTELGIELPLLSAGEGALRRRP